MYAMTLQSFYVAQETDLQISCENTNLEQEKKN